MEHIITRIIIAIAVIATVSYAAAYSSYLLNEFNDANIGNLPQKGLQIGSSLFDLSPSIIFGVSTGTKTMATVELGTSKIAINASGDAISWTFAKSAIIVRGIEIAGPQSIETSTNSSDCILLYSNNSNYYMQPKVLVKYSTNSTDLGRIKAHWLSVYTCCISNFSVSGNYDILKENQKTSRHLYERLCLYDANIVMMVNGLPTFTFKAIKGEKIFVESVHFNIKLTPLLR